MSPRHGDYDPGKGWYSDVTKGWHSDPKKIGRVINAPSVEHLRGEFDRMNKPGFQPQSQLERLIALRDSDRADDRAKFEKIAHGSTRVALHDYEAAKAKAEGEGQ